MIRIYPVIGAIVCGVDQVLKQWAEKKLKLGEERCVGKYIRLRKVYNRGAALNFLQDRPKVLRPLTTIAMTAALIYDAVLLGQKGRHLEKAAMMLLTGGALSNFADRIFRGKVIDYIGFHTPWKKVSHITYNTGDFAIFAGAILTMIAGCMQQK